MWYLQTILFYRVFNSKKRTDCNFIVLFPHIFDSGVNFCGEKFCGNFFFTGTFFFADRGKNRKNYNPQKFRATRYAVSVLQRANFIYSILKIIRRKVIITVCSKWLYVTRGIFPQRHAFQETCSGQVNTSEITVFV